MKSQKLSKKNPFQENPSLAFDYAQRRRLKINKAVASFYSRRNYLENELKEVNSALLKLLNQLHIDDEYKYLNHYK